MLIHHFGAETQGLVDQNDREKVLRKKILLNSDQLLAMSHLVYASMAFT